MKLVLSMPGFRTLAQESIETVVKNRLKAKDCVICKFFVTFFHVFQQLPSAVVSSRSIINLWCRVLSNLYVYNLCCCTTV